MKGLDHHEVRGREDIYNPEVWSAGVHCLRLFSCSSFACPLVVGSVRLGSVLFGSGFSVAPAIGEGDVVFVRVRVPTLSKVHSLRMSGLLSV
ncbi:MAG: hypothetical protein ACK56F_06445, partial [bacterium]